MNIYADVCAYKQICVDICIYTDMCAYMRVYLHICVQICIYAHIYVYTRAYMHICRYAYDLQIMQAPQQSAQRGTSVGPFSIFGYQL